MRDSQSPEPGIWHQVPRCRYSVHGDQGFTRTETVCARCIYDLFSPITTVHNTVLVNWSCQCGLRNMPAYSAVVHLIPTEALSRKKLNVNIEQKNKTPVPHVPRHQSAVPALSPKTYSSDQPRISRPVHIGTSASGTMRHPEAPCGTIAVQNHPMAAQARP